MLPEPDEQSPIAVLDDEANQRIALKRLLHAHGYSVALFEKGESLLEAHQKRPFHRILLDLGLPGMSGFAVLERLSPKQGECRVIVVSALDLQKSRDRLHQLGAFACLTKPVDQESLIRALESAATNEQGYQSGAL